MGGDCTIPSLSCSMPSRTIALRILSMPPGISPCGPPRIMFSISDTKDFFSLSAGRLITGCGVVNVCTDCALRKVLMVVVDEGGREIGGRRVGDRAVILACEQPSEGIKTVSHALRMSLLTLADLTSCLLGKYRYRSSTLASKQEDGLGSPNGHMK